jgi:hypothetical protein
MSTFRNKSFLLASVMAAIAVTFYLFASEWQELHDDACAGVTRIASDSQKMTYVKSWIASRTSDQEFMNEVRRNRFFEPGDPRLHEHIDLDWAYLGLTPELVSLAFNVKNAAKRDFDATRIESVSLGQGRTTIIIRLSKSEDFGLLWPTEELSRIKPIADEIFVYCGA